MPKDLLVGQMPGKETMEKIRINNREFFVINERDGGRYTLCVAAEPWGESIWGKGCNGQTILDIADNRNPESLTYEWFQGLPEEIKSAIKTVRVTTNDENPDGTGLIKQTEMFVPSYKEFKKVPQKIRAMIATRKSVWSRSYDGTYCGCSCAYFVNSDGNVQGSNQGNSYVVAPAFYISNNLLKSRYEIVISYSWGEKEPPYGSFMTQEEAYKKMCEMAGREAYVQNEEFLPENTCAVYFNAAEKEIDLHYDNDDSWCYYRVQKVQNEEVPEKSE